MQARVQWSLPRVWAVAATTFVLAAGISRSLAASAAAKPAYWTGLVGLLALGAALWASWRHLGAPGTHSAVMWRVLRLVVVLGALLWVVAMLFPFL